MDKEFSHILNMQKQSSESLLCGILLALSGGAMDAYSYLARGHVFANAQTGNMLLFGVHLVAGNIAETIKYISPIMAFCLGIMLSDLLRIKEIMQKIVWKKIVLLVEMVVLTAVIYVPIEYNIFADAMISFACGMQVESFQIIQGNNIATTMCIGNFRNGIYNIDQYLYTHDLRYLKKAILFLGVIAFFVIGAVIESIIVNYCGKFGIIASVILLLFVFVTIKC